MDDDQFENLMADIAAGRWEANPHLSLLSHLEGEQHDRFSAVWTQLGEQQKVAFIDALSNRELADPRLEFNGVYHLGMADDEALVRRRSIESTVEDDSPWLLEHLLALLADDPDAAVRAAAATGLEPFAQRAELGDLAPGDARRIRDLLLQAVHRPDERHNVQAAALEAVGYFTDDAVRQELASGFDDDNLRLPALRGMGHSADPAWLETVLGELDDSDEEVRQAAAQAVGEIGEESAVRELANLVDDEVLSVRLTAIAALGEIGGPEARDALIYALQGEDEAIREAAQSALDGMDFYEDPLAR